jgi:DNA-binding transcriptional regulator WhiA
MAATTPAVFKRGVTHYLKRLQRMYPNAREHEVKVMEAPV